jgi:hypothetical protein
MNRKWNERYKSNEFAYGKLPNVFFKEWLQKSERGAILMPADGEGRNGVFAATQGWKVTSFDLSIEGKGKAMKLAEECGVQLSYIVGDFYLLQFDKESFDAIGLIYAHFSGDMKQAFHRKLDGYLKPGGIVIFEAFSKNHIPYKQQNPKVGGPDDLKMLYSKEEILADFGNYEILVLTENEVLLEEGQLHNGKGAVVRFVGIKKS